MKKIGFILLVSIAMASCKKESLNKYVTLQGKFTSNADSIITISARDNNFSKTIKINTDGTFKDTLKVVKGDVYFMQTNVQNRVPIYLKNGYDLTLNGKMSDFLNTFSYSGNGSESNKFILAQIAFSKKMGSPINLFALDKDAFTAKIDKINKQMDSLVNRYSDADSVLISNTKLQQQQMISYFRNNYDVQHESAMKRVSALEKLAKGNISPSFVDYENFKGGKTSLSDLKGKYVYIDVWATWCGPCVREIPALKALENQYHGKNIEFVSISTDKNTRNGGSWEKAHDKWKKFVADKQLSGIQLWSGKDYSFQQAYQINSIPRFILIDPQGKIVDKNAPRPSSPEIKNLFNELGI
ncbi:TlpA family protein disulfide reductase [Tenacibaculum sp. UWU-22]|uniref:TlpA family protein disulfide reductase n=1 Tax=Tenacibaculum sp. UWU-22 TaxID=3234187 RepID=UPI0034DB6124